MYVAVAVLTAVRCGSRIGNSNLMKQPGWLPQLRAEATTVHCTFSRALLRGGVYCLIQQLKVGMGMSMRLSIMCLFLYSTIVRR